ncbi:hypothetical protein M440DRAFT_1248441 [Trichoderma longibrachiatum ATCC 18648]|uniref:Uncharacterized protein n=1 Tax=Trichoderma longibrachiatum ATCC 18648 TaxID=983965 RepID=A0A2T4C3W3_TRILO|nr:hypothetical protein M440DRAFT_1248441 [Trichoderma longibrachiatum ATCC 18648]
MTTLHQYPQIRELDANGASSATIWCIRGHCSPKASIRAANAPDCRELHYSAISYRRTGSRKRRFDSGTSRLPRVSQCLCCSRSQTAALGSFRWPLHIQSFGQAGWIVWLQPTKTCSSAAAKCNPSFCLSALLGSDTAMVVVQIYGCDHGRQLCRKVPTCGEPRSRPGQRSVLDLFFSPQHHTRLPRHVVCTAKRLPKVSSQPSSWALQNRYCKRRCRR